MAGFMFISTSRLRRLAMSMESIGGIPSRLICAESIKDDVDALVKDTMGVADKISANEFMGIRIESRNYCPKNMIILCDAEGVSGVMNLETGVIVHMPKLNLINDPFFRIEKLI
jgi:hypothetical protein